MKGDRRYAPRECFQTFPFPQNPLAESEAELENTGQSYHDYRRQLMLKTQIGLTKIYNQFHNPKLPAAHELEGITQNSSAPDGTSQIFPSLDGESSSNFPYPGGKLSSNFPSPGKRVLPLFPIPGGESSSNFPSPGGRGSRGGGNQTEKEIEKQYGKETLNLWNHLKRTPNTCSLNEAVEGIIELRRLHKEMDETVLKAYGWTDVNLAHDFYEVDYLPENDRIRYTISPEARREILKRLLKLNHEIHEQEQKEGKIPKTKTKEMKRGHKPGTAKQLNMF